MNGIAASRHGGMRWLFLSVSTAAGLLLAQAPSLAHAQQATSSRAADKVLSLYPERPQLRGECTQAHEAAMQRSRAEHQLGNAGISQREQFVRERIAACSQLSGSGNNAYWRCVEPYDKQIEELGKKISGHFAERDRIHHEIIEADKTCEKAARANESAFADIEKTGKRINELYEAGTSPAGPVKGIATYAAKEALDSAKSEVIDSAYAKRNDHLDPAVAKLFKDAAAVREANDKANPVAGAVADEAFKRLESQSHQTMGDLNTAMTQIDSLNAADSLPTRSVAPATAPALPRRGSSSATAAMQGAIDRSKNVQAQMEFDRAERDHQARDAEALRQTAAAPALGGLAAVGAGVVAMQGNPALARQMLEVADRANPAVRSEAPVPSAQRTSAATPPATARAATTAAVGASTGGSIGGCAAERATLQAQMPWAPIPDDYMAVPPIYPAFQLRQMISEIQAGLARLEGAAGSQQRALELKLQLCNARGQLAESEAREQARARGALETSKPCTAEVERLSRVARTARKDSISETARVAHTLAIRATEAIRRCPPDPFLDQLVLDLQQTASTTRETCEMVTSDHSVCRLPWPGF